MQDIRVAANPLDHDCKLYAQFWSSRAKVMQTWIALLTAILMHLISCAYTHLHSAHNLEVEIPYNFSDFFVVAYFTKRPQVVCKVQMYRQLM